MAKPKTAKLWNIQPSDSGEVYSAPHSGGETSRLAAAVQTAFKANLTHRKILHALRHGPLSRDAIEDKTGIMANTLRPRISELLKAGKIFVYDNGGTTRVGNKAERLALKEN